MSKAFEFLNNQEGVIRAALGKYERDMREAEKEAREAYQAGQADPQVKAAQDASVIANRGYLHAANMFRESAESAVTALEEMMDVLLD
ncbi:hypothetical protein ACFYO2_26530 [Streptomyces sp. NPDC006602]|uniref:hypothetical protein n=1 Tax=Streptomyces sp. NPDC006602 TaxID=3364751 RepID=UPI0036C48F7B